MFLIRFPSSSDVFTVCHGLCPPQNTLSTTLASSIAVIPVRSSPLRSLSRADSSLSSFHPRGPKGYLNLARSAQRFIRLGSSTTFTTFIAMFSSTLRPSLVALVASAVAVYGAPGLSVKASVPNAQVQGLEYLKVTTTITNTGDETLKLLNDPRGVLNSFPENTFSITDGTGSRPSFNGARASHELVTRRSTYTHVFGFHP